MIPLRVNLEASVWSRIGNAGSKCHRMGSLENKDLSLSNAACVSAVHLNSVFLRTKFVNSVTTLE